MREIELNTKDLIKILNDPQENEFWETFLKAATTATTSQMNATRVASEIYLAKTLKTNSIAIQEELENTGDKLRDALQKLAKALSESAIAANKHAKGLKWATWALVLATVGLIIATVF